MASGGLRLPAKMMTRASLGFLASMKNSAGTVEYSGSENAEPKIPAENPRHSEHFSSRNAAQTGTYPRRLEDLWQ